MNEVNTSAAWNAAALGTKSQDLNFKLNIRALSVKMWMYDCIYSRGRRGMPDRIKLNAMLRLDVALLPEQVMHSRREALRVWAALIFAPAQNVVCSSSAVACRHETSVMVDFGAFGVRDQGFE